MGDIELNKREQWLEERKKGIGGSDAAAILGLNPYMTNVDLWEIKTGRKEQKDISQKDCVKFGVEAEDHIRKLFALDYPEFEVSNEDFKLFTNKKYPFIKGSFDGTLIHKPTSASGVFEVKTTTIRRQIDWEKWTNQIPMNYFCQLLHYFLCREDFKFAVLKARIKELIKTNNSIFNEQKVCTRHYFIDRSEYEADLEMLLEKEIEFWGYVQRDERPPLLLPEL